jgi:hypothetical protein
MWIIPTGSNNGRIQNINIQILTKTTKQIVLPITLIKRIKKLTNLPCKIMLTKHGTKIFLTPNLEAKYKLTISTTIG